MKPYLISALAVGFTLGALLFSAHSANAQVTGNLWKISSNYLEPVLSTWGLQVPSLASQNCIGTDGSGKFQAGTCSGGGSAFPFDVTSFGVSTSTIVDFINGIITSASTTFAGATTTVTGALQLGSTAADHALTFVAPSRAYSTSVSVGGAANLTFTNSNNGLYLYSAGTGTLFSVDCNNSTLTSQCFRIQSTDTANSVINVQGESNSLGVIKVSSLGDQTVNGSLISLDSTTNSNTGQGLFIKTNATGLPLNIVNSGSSKLFQIDPLGNSTTTGNAQITGLAASKIVRTDANHTLAPVTVGSGLSFDGTTLSATGVASNALGSTTPWTPGQLAMIAGDGTLTGVGTSTLTAGSGLTGSFTQIGSGGSLGCATANGSTFGCLASADWTTFNNKQATISATYPITFSANTVGWGGVGTSSPFTTGFAGVNAAGNLYTFATSTIKTSQLTNDAGFLAAVTADSPLSGSGTSGSHLTLNTSGTWSGNAGTATALAADGSNCAAGYFPLGVDASGASQNCTYAFATSTPWSTGFMAINAAGQGYTVASSSLNLPNTALQNSSITVNGTSFALGSSHTITANTTNSLSPDGATLTGTSFNGSASVSDWAIDLTHANTWTGKQTFTNASSTLFSTAYASSTAYFGAGLASCNGGSNALTWNAGTFGCNTISAGSSVWPFTTTDTNYSVAVQSTTTPEWFKTPVSGPISLMASSTAVFDNASTSLFSVGGSFIKSGGTGVLTFPAVTDTLAAGTGSANRLAFWSGTNQLTSNAALVVNSANTTVGFGIAATNSRRENILTDSTVTQGLGVSGDSTSRVGLASFVTGDAQLRFSFLLDGTMKWSDGTNAPDVTLSRTGTNTLTLGSGDTFAADAASTTGASASSYLTVKSNYVNSLWHVTIGGFATSTAGTGTSTVAGPTFIEGGTIKRISCGVENGVGTWNVKVCYGPSNTCAAVVVASSTHSVVDFSSNNMPGTNATSTISYGTAASSPTYTPDCTLEGTWGQSN